MPDLLPPRLLARVERSLRKRISADVHPHLLRCADHAHSPEDFVVSAARLLLNPAERAQWLASWRRRLQQAAEAQEAEGPTASAPAPLDTTSPAALGEAVQRSFHITPQQLAAIEEALVQELGPSGSLLVDREARHSESTDELLDRLQQHLPDDHGRARFVNSSLSHFQTEG